LKIHFQQIPILQGLTKNKLIFRFLTLAFFNQKIKAIYQGSCGTIAYNVLALGAVADKYTKTFG
jgi:hypothetical protein